ncbi:NAD(P)-binding protein [Microthyrium microscopicum]|uniref:NAD(P)-binding protein n=1 Tax=Microthyrium microscopicum TaxID=703497 RepID=A0A6A6UD59_9PEZI|nr:NAD(P)-binding protein [Microthyrium microscopicum]
MSSYVITGASRGLGFEFLRQLSADPSNTVIGLVRGTAATETKVAELGRKNIHILKGDLTEYSSLKRAAEETAKITGGSLDYLIANAAFVSRWSAYDPIGVLGKDSSKLEEDLKETLNANVVGNVHLFNLFTPLILKGKVKKVISISTGLADYELLSKFEIEGGAPYSISKAALNAAVAHFSAQYAKDGVLFISISPGVVETGQHANATPEQLQKAMAMGGKFVAYAPHFTGPAQPESSVKDVISVYEKASVAAGDGGSFISHLGNKQWI